MRPSGDTSQRSARLGMVALVTGSLRTKPSNKAAPTRLSSTVVPMAGSSDSGSCPLMITRLACGYEPPHPANKNMSSAANNVCAGNLMSRIYFGFCAGAVVDVPVAAGGLSPPMPDEGVGFTGVASGAGAAVGVLDNSPVLNEEGVAFGRLANSSDKVAAFV